MPFVNILARLSHLNPVSRRENIYDLISYKVFWNEPISLSELEKAIQKTRFSTLGLGEDGILARIYNKIPNLNKKGLNTVLQIYKDGFATGHIPENWKSAVILPN